MELKRTEFKPNHLATSGTGSDFASTANVVRTDKTFIVKDFFETNEDNTIMGKGQMINRRVFSSNSINSSTYTMASGDFLLGVTSLAYPPNIGLPLPVRAGVGKLYIVKDETGGAGTTTITIQSNGEKLIDGASSTTLTSNYQSKSFYSNGGNWYTY